MPVEHQGRAYASLIFRGRDLNPLYISEYLEITPSISFKRGEKRNEIKDWPHGYWELSSSDEINTGQLQPHLEWLMDKIEPKKLIIKQLLTDETITSVISCFWILTGGHDALDLNPQLLIRISSLQIEIVVDIYCGE